MPKFLNFDPQAENHPELTYEDVFMVPNNPVSDCLFERMCVAEESQLSRKFDEVERTESVSETALRSAKRRDDPSLRTFQEAALNARKEWRRSVIELAEKYGIGKHLSRDRVDFSPIDGFGNVPIVVSNMNNVAGKRMAEVIARMGATVALPQDKSNEELEQIFHYLRKECSVDYWNPIVVTLGTKIHEFRRLIDKRVFRHAVVVNEGGECVAVVSEDDINKKRLNTDCSIEEALDDHNYSVASVREEDNKVTPRDALKNMESKNVDFLPVLDAQGNLLGAHSKKTAAYALRYKPHVDDKGLVALPTVGAFNRDPLDRIRFLIDLKVQGILMDTAHFDQGTQGYKNVEAAANLIAKRASSKIRLIAGNVVTGEATKDILAAGADIVKVGIGPGAMCTTRVETGVGRPQFSAVYECAQEATKLGKHVWADGGIRSPGDLAKALAAGASQVMYASLYAATYESPPDFVHENGHRYKVNSGMASRLSSVQRSQRMRRETDAELFRHYAGHRAEGLDESKAYQHSDRQSAADVVHWKMNGYTSSMTYANAKDNEEFYQNAAVGKQTPGGNKEGQPLHQM